MQQKNIKAFIFPIIAIFIFVILLFAAGYAYFVGSTSMNAANYQVTLPKVTTLTCSKTDCGVTITPQMMYNTNTNATTPKATSNCSLACTCSGTQGAVCSYNVRLIEMGQVYTPSASLGSSKEFTAKVTSPAGCTAQNSSSTETQLNTIRDKVVSSCALTVPASGSVSANVSAEFKWYNLNLDQSAHANAQYIYQLTNDNQQYTVTLDPNGGSVSQSTIQVTYGEPYGQIPTPTWSGHTFRGWNGKNKFNKDASSIAGIKNETEVELWASTVLNNNWVLKNLKPSTTYRASYSVVGVSVPSYDSLYSGDIGFLLYSGVSGYSYASMRGGHYIGPGEGYKVSINFTTPSNLHDTAGNYRLLGYSNRYLKNNVGIFAKVIFHNIQIEEGTEETLYEPYYITSSTKVTQAQNHTLTAIWD